MSKYLKKSERKRQIKDAAIELFKTKGFRLTSVQDIVSKANTSKGGFYNCYPSKIALIKEIIYDGISYRSEQMLTFKNTNKDLDRKSLFIEILLDKMLSYNEYKKLYSMLLVEMATDQDLLNYYKDSSKDARNMFIEFCKKEGFDEWVRLSNQEFEVFINSLIVGVDIFGFYDSEKYRDMIRTMITEYFEKIDLFNLEGEKDA